MTRIEILYSFKDNDCSWFQHLSMVQFVQVWNGMSDYVTPKSGGKIYPMSELDEHFDNIYDFARATMGTTFNPEHKWFWIGPEGKVYSFNCVWWGWRCFNEAAEWATEPGNYDLVIDIQRKGLTLHLEEDDERYAVCKMLREG